MYTIIDCSHVIVHHVKFKQICKKEICVYVFAAHLYTQYTFILVRPFIKEL